MSHTFTHLPFPLRLEPCDRPEIPGDKWFEYRPDDDPGFSSGPFVQVALWVYELTGEDSFRVCPPVDALVPGEGERSDVRPWSGEGERSDVRRFSMFETKVGGEETAWLFCHPSGREPGSWCKIADHIDADRLFFWLGGETLNIFLEDSHSVWDVSVTGGRAGLAGSALRVGVLGRETHFGLERSCLAPDTARAGGMVVLFDEKLIRCDSRLNFLFSAHIEDPLGYSPIIQKYRKIGVSSSGRVFLKSSGWMTGLQYGFCVFNPDLSLAGFCCEPCVIVVGFRTVGDTLVAKFKKGEQSMYFKVHDCPGSPNME